LSDALVNAVAGRRKVVTGELLCQGCGSVATARWRPAGRCCATD
jgi:hypothetical protein